MARSHPRFEYDTLANVAARFRLLGDPMRLSILNALSSGERAVNDLVAETGANQANVSKHLGVLARSGVVTRRKEGLRVYYAIADASVFELCDIVCGSLRAYLTRELATLPPPPRARRTRR